jgi:hypothetical protein
MKDKIIKIEIPETCFTGTKKVIIPDNHTPINSNVDFVLATDSMIKESNTDKRLKHYFAKKGVNRCSDIFSATGKLDEQETTINLTSRENKELLTTVTAKLTKKNYVKRGYPQWTININGGIEKVIYILPKRLFDFNKQENKNRVDFNRAALRCILDFSKITFEDRSEEKAFDLIKKTKYLK